MLVSSADETARDVYRTLAAPRVEPAPNLRRRLSTSSSLPAIPKRSSISAAASSGPRFARSKRPNDTACGSPLSAARAAILGPKPRARPTSSSTTDSGCCSTSATDRSGRCSGSCRSERHRCALPEPPARRPLARSRPARARALASPATAPSAGLAGHGTGHRARAHRRRIRPVRRPILMVSFRSGSGRRRDRAVRRQAASARSIRSRRTRFALPQQGKSLVYTADTGPFDELAHFAQGADLLAGRGRFRRRRTASAGDCTSPVARPASWRVPPVRVCSSSRMSRHGTTISAHSTKRPARCSRARRRWRGRALCTTSEGGCSDR